MAFHNGLTSAPRENKYRDDSLQMASTIEQCRIQVIKSVHLSDALGFVAHTTKYFFRTNADNRVPVPWLHPGLYQYNMSVSLSERKRQNVGKLASELYKKETSYSLSWKLPNALVP